MKRRELLTGMGSLAVAGKWGESLAALETPAQQQPERATRMRDVIFLMTDQQRWDAIGRLNPLIQTPHLDSLAGKGILFTQATCQAPMCVPSRNSMMSGLYPSQLGIRSNESHAIADRFLPLPVLPERMHAAGYQTAGFGKTHWGLLDQPPSTRGFEVRVVGPKALLLENGATYMEDGNPQGLAAYMKETADYGPGEEGVPGYVGCTSAVAERDHPDGWIAEQCLKFLDGGVDPNRPLFLYLSFIKPHAGFNVPKHFEDLYRIDDIPDTPEPPWSDEPETHLAYRDRVNAFLGGRYREWRAAFSKMSPIERRRTTLRYYANCSWLDSYFGQVLSKLERLGRLHDALIVFVSDHGEMLGERNFQFSKYCLCESSVRVPVILSGTAVPESLRGVIDERPVELVDVLPTIVGAAGLKPVTELPGLDLFGDGRHAASFCEFHDSGSPAYMWRTKDWKLILYMACPLQEAMARFNQSRGELYDLREDPHEWKNLYAEPAHAPIREQLKTELLMHLACLSAAYPQGKG
jgi:arylsulfatase A-like enzyme